jgi:hypothetical protein
MENSYIYSLRQGLEQRLFKDSICIFNSLCSSAENLDVHSVLRLQMCSWYVNGRKYNSVGLLETLGGVIAMCPHKLPVGRILVLDVAAVWSGVEREARSQTHYGTTTTK